MAYSDGKKRRITLDLDEELLSGVDDLAGLVSESRNAFITSAIASRLRVERRARTDAEFAAMNSDEDHQQMLAEEERRWAPASDDAWRLIDTLGEPAKTPRAVTKPAATKERRAAR